MVSAHSLASCWCFWWDAQGGMSEEQRIKCWTLSPAIMQVSTVIRGITCVAWLEISRLFSMASLVYRGDLQLSSRCRRDDRSRSMVRLQGWQVIADWLGPFPYLRSIIDYEARNFRCLTSGPVSGNVDSLMFFTRTIRCQSCAWFPL